MSRQRVLFFLVAGFVLLLAGLWLVARSRFADDNVMLAVGFGVYSAAMALLVHARVAKLEDKVRDLQAKWHEHCSAGRTAPHCDEPEEPEPDTEPAGGS